ncbi:MAG TPA: hypothetical protein VH088_07740 [Terriglobales bacterium]|jgi:hypothetical protein|nr:hypothetical protein [Terriglobales bacterium]
MAVTFEEARDTARVWLESIGLNEKEVEVALKVEMRRWRQQNANELPSTATQQTVLENEVDASRTWLAEQRKASVKSHEAFLRGEIIREVE